MTFHAAKGKLIAVIGDEVSTLVFSLNKNIVIFSFV